MPTDFEELKRKLLQTDEEFRQLATQHHDLDEKIHSLFVRTRTNRRNDAEEEEAPAQGPDGVDPAASQPRQQRGPGGALTPIPLTHLCDRNGPESRASRPLPGPSPF
jgi:uncharacterized protein YdcH (DUF465 family)